MERRLAAVWAEVLELDAVGVDDDFFQLGGHSLKAARLAFRISEDTGVLFTLTEIFQHPTVAAMAQLAETRAATDDRAARPRHDRPIPVAPMTSDELDMLND